MRDPLPKELKAKINDMINRPVVGSGYQLKEILFEIIDRLEEALKIIDKIEERISSQKLPNQSLIKEK